MREEKSSSGIIRIRVGIGEPLEMKNLTLPALHYSKVLVLMVNSMISNPVNNRVLKWYRVENHQQEPELPCCFEGFMRPKSMSPATDACEELIKTHKYKMQLGSRLTKQEKVSPKESFKELKIDEEPNEIVDRLMT